MGIEIILSPDQLKAFLACAEIGAEGYPEGWDMEKDVDWIRDNLLSDNIISMKVTVKM